MDRVLIVEDNKLAVEIENDLLTAWGYQTKTCGNSTEVFDSVLDFRPDVILLDIMLPGMNGYAICNKLKAAAETNTIPNTMLSGLNEMEDRMQDYDMGAGACLTKPVKYQELKSRVEWAVRYKKSMDAMEPKEKVVCTLLNLLQAVSPNTYRRGTELARYCRRVAKVLCVVDENMEQLITGCYLHDIGRIVSDDPAGHIEAGLKIVAPLNMHTWLDDYIRYHHESIDGAGFQNDCLSADMRVNLKIMMTVDRFLSLSEQIGSETKALARLKAECQNGEWCERVCKALEQSIRDADFKKKIVTM